MKMSDADDPKNRLHLLVAVAVFFLALGLKLGYAWETNRHRTGAEGINIAGYPLNDSETNYRAAMVMYNRGGLRTAGPGDRIIYPAFVASLFRTMGAQPVVAFAFNFLASALSTAVLAYLGCQWISIPSGIGLGLLRAAEQSILLRDQSYFSESIGASLFIWQIFEMYLGIQLRTLSRLFLSGIVFGLCNAYRPMTFPGLPLFMLVAFILQWQQKWRFWHAIQGQICFLAGAACILVPTMGLMYREFKTPNLSTNFPTMFYAATSPKHPIWTFSVEREATAAVGNEPKDRNRFFMENAIKNLRDDPSVYGNRILKRLEIVFLFDFELSKWGPYALGLLLAVILTNGAIAITYSATTIISKLYSVALCALLIACTLYNPGLVALGGLVAALRFGRGNYLPLVLISLFIGTAAIVVVNNDAKRQLLMFDWCYLFLLFAGAGSLFPKKKLSTAKTEFAFEAQESFLLERDSSNLFTRLPLVSILCTIPFIAAPIWTVFLNLEPSNEVLVQVASETEIRRALDETRRILPNVFVGEENRVQLSRDDDPLFGTKGDLADRYVGENQGRLLALTGRIDENVIEVAANSKPDFVLVYRQFANRNYDRSIYCIRNNRDDPGKLIQMPRDKSKDWRGKSVLVVGRLAWREWDGWIEGLAIFPIDPATGRVDLAQGEIVNQVDHLKAVSRLAGSAGSP